MFKALKSIANLTCVYILAMLFLENMQINFFFYNLDMYTFAVLEHKTDICEHYKISKAFIQQIKIDNCKCKNKQSVI